MPNDRFHESESVLDSGATDSCAPDSRSEEWGLLREAEEDKCLRQQAGSKLQ